MKKIYSIVLMAAALLVGTNVNAAVKTAGTPDELVKLFNGTAEQKAADGDEIQLTANIALTQTVVLLDGRSLKLNLGGFTLSADFRDYAYQAPITLAHGTLQVYNGTVLNAGNRTSTSTTKDNTKSGAAIEVFGAGLLNAGDVQMIGTIGDKNYDNWSNLIIGDDNGSVTNISATCTSTLKGSTAPIQKGAGVEVYAFGETTLTSANIPALAELDYRSIYWSGTYNAKNQKVYYHVAYGVNITVKAKANVYGSKYGLQISGNIQDRFGHADKLPKVVVEEGADISADGDALESTGIYGAGAGSWDIHGEVHGATGAYFKSGTAVIGDGAVVYSESNTYSVPEDKNSGKGASGSAIIFDSQKAYDGEIDITITGSAVVGKDAEGNQKGGGYAVEGNKAADSENKLVGLHIEGGEITGGGQGTMEPNVLTDAVSDGSEFTLNGVTINPKNDDDYDAIGALINATIKDNTIIIAQTSDGSYSFEEAPKGTVIEPNEDLNTTTATYVSLTGSEQTLTKDVELTYLQLSATTTSPSTPSKVIIPSGKTLKVGSIAMDETSIIEVQAGGKLIISGENGLIAKQKTNIKIEYKNGVAGLFYLAPEAKANKNPAATVELTSKKAYKDGSKYIYERLGMPAYNGMKVNDVVTTVPAAQVAVVYWNDGWKVLNKAQNVAPFVGLGLTTQVTDPGDGIVFNFPCNLMGNANADLNVAAKWSYFANSYMANVDLKTFAEAIEANVPGVAQGVYLDPQGKEKWNPVSLLDLKQGMGETKLNPMQGFILNRTATDDAVVTINYNDMVWPTRLPASSGKAARNRVMDENLTRVKITITNEDGIYDYVTLRQSDEYTAEIDNSGDMEKYMSAVGANLYAVSNELGNMAQIATDNMDGMILGVAANKNEVCKMTFSYVCGEQMAIRDNLTGATITMVEGAEYFFTATEGDNANRFEIVAVKNAPTDVETVVETTGAKAVYTVLGQYMGTTEDWNTLPNGIYVVDGVKMVK